MVATGDNSTFKTGFRKNIIDSVRSRFDFNNSDRYFLFAGKADGWTGGQTMDTLVDTRSQDIELWRNIVGLKQIDINSVFYMATRYDWTSNVKYDMYDHLVDMVGKKYYVMTSDYHVYKCLDNNNVNSSVQPTGVKTQGTIHTADGYIWKYLFTIPEPYRYYINDDLIPVIKLLARGTSTESKNQWAVQTNAQDGSIELIYTDPTVTPPNYTSTRILPANPTVNLTKQTSIAGATAISLATAHVDIAAAYNGLVINITSREGAGQRRVISGYTGGTDNHVLFETPLTKDVPINSVYEIAPRVQIVGDGVSAEAYVNLYDYDSGNTDQKKTQDIVVSAVGKDYTYAFCQFSPAAQLEAGGDVESARPILSPEGGHGSDAVSELNCTSLLVVVNIDQDEDNNFFTENEVRQYGIIKNPILNETDYLDINGNPYRVAGTETSLRTFLEVTAVAQDIFLPESLFNVGRYVMGKNSKATGKIEAWSPALDANHGILTISNLKGEFDTPVDGSGTGEGVVEFSQVADEWAFYSAGVGAVSAFDKVYQNTTPSYNCNYTMGVTSSAGGLDSSTFPIDAPLTGGAGTSSPAEPTGMCLNWVVNPGGTGGDLTVSNVTGTFNTGDFIGHSEVASSIIVIDSIVEPEIKTHTGEILYAQNMKPIERDPEQREQYQIILKF